MELGGGVYVFDGLVGILDPSKTPPRRATAIDMK
jgi:hypothetical protein